MCLHRLVVNFFLFFTCAWFLWNCFHTTTFAHLRPQCMGNGTNIISSSFIHERVSNEYIVRYVGFYSFQVRHNFFKARYNNCCTTECRKLVSPTYRHVTIIDRNNSYPSDFDVLILRGTSEKCEKLLLNKLASHPMIKDVTEQRRIIRLFNKFYSRRSRKRDSPTQITSVLSAKALWDLGITGSGVKVAIFDTGLSETHPHFRNIRHRSDWTNENTLDDMVGHGSFVTGIIASSAECLGFAPDADIYSFRVFTNRQVSYTSWFLDAFNYAILKKINVLNLSIGGPDFMDKPFIEKVWELTASGIVMISAIGNDGPLYGTLNNPADQMDVIGVGGIDFSDRLAVFSSRGMTTWELPTGYGRIKPDLVTYGTAVIGSDRRGGCRLLSGTSVSSPVVAGAVTLLLSGIKLDINPAVIKQALMITSHRIPGLGMFEQGSGKLDLIKAFYFLKEYEPQVTLSPNYVDMTECPYFWPYCTQPMYYSAMPLIVNVTILNGMSVSGAIIKAPRWHSYVREEFIRVAFDYSPVLWPWSGYVAIYLSVNQAARNFSGVIEGFVSLEVGPSLDSEASFFVNLPIRLKIIPTPPKEKRILWDQFHNLGYPPGYFPRDDLRSKDNLLDWNADHIHTNFRHLYDHLRWAGYFVEVLSSSYECFNASFYSTLLLVDPEEEYFSEEITKLNNDVDLKGLSLIVLADWFNVSIMRDLRFYDENTKRWWNPDTGGCNIPAVNELLEHWGIAFGDLVLNGSFSIGNDSCMFASGSPLIRFPFSNQSKLFWASNLTVRGLGVEPITTSINALPILGMHQVAGDSGGRIIVYGDSNCIDSRRFLASEKYCWWLFDVMLDYATTGTCHNDVCLWLQSGRLYSPTLPSRKKKSRLRSYSRVMGHLSFCVQPAWSSSFTIYIDDEDVFNFPVLPFNSSFGWSPNFSQFEHFENNLNVPKMSSKFIAMSIFFFLVMLLFYFRALGRTCRYKSGLLKHFTFST